MKNYKAITSIILLFALIISSSNNLIAYAVSEVNNIEIGQKYEKIKKKPTKLYSLDTLDNGKELPEEALDDLNALNNIEYLQKLTNKKYEVALLDENGNYTYLDDSNSYEEAKQIANSTLNQKNLEKGLTPVVIDKDGLVTYAASNSIAKIVKLKDGQTITATIDIYKTSTSTSRYTYISHAYIDDAPIIDESGNRVKVQINGLTGWINKSDSEGTNVIVVPANNSLNLSYYKKNSSGELQHYISSDVQKTNSGHTRLLGKAPSFMEVNKKYYSYDGIYFYTDINVLINDLKNNTKNNAVNKSNPYYNYYLYLPGRSKTSHYAKEIESYIQNNTPSDSVLRGQGINLVKAQNKYGVNANLILAVAMNESAKGTSNLAKTKNNLFGIKAYDTNVGAATTFNTVGGCIDTFAKEYMSNQYFNPKAWQYSGSNLGNKKLGANVWYASDPFWGEKAVSYMYEMDKYISGSGTLIENNKYQLGIYNSATKVKNSSGTTLYEILTTRSSNTGQVGDPVILLSQESNNYVTYPDRNYSISSSPPVAGEYNWTMLGYVSTNSVTKINTKNTNPRKESNSKPVINASNKELKEGDSFNPLSGVSATDNEDGNLTSAIVVKTNTVNTKVAGTYKVIYEVTDADFNTVTKEISVKVVNPCWVKENGKWYYYINGVKQTGWLNLNGAWYYLRSNGEMATGWEKVNGKWYYLLSSGAMKTGWLDLNGIWYYLRSNGEMATGWEKVNGKWYYLLSSGAMKTGWLDLNGIWYYLRSNGEMATGWEKVNGKWYYLLSSGAMKTGWLDLNGIWYYLRSNGEMATGWEKVNGKWYYMYSSGKMATNTTIDGWKIDKNGVATKIK